MRRLLLIQAALRPGTTLQHRAHKLMPVDALHALGRCDPQGVALVHGKIGGVDLPRLRAVVIDAVIDLAVAQQWSVPNRRKFSGADTLQAFCEQVWREYLGEICDRCKGHGVTGIKLDNVRHRLNQCNYCNGEGRTIYVSRSGLPLQQLCKRCLGKGLMEITEAVKASRLHACPRCDSTGMTLASNRTRARVLRYDVAHIHRIWRPRFSAVLRTLRTLERRALFEAENLLYPTETIDATKTQRYSS